MKIAYCFSGYVRRFWDNRTLLDNILNLSPGDIFVHTWNTLNYGGSTWHGDRGLSDIEVDLQILTRLQEMYGDFTNLVVEAPPKFPEHIMPVIQARYSIKRANDLKREHERNDNFLYDIVLNLRFDLMMLEPFKFPEQIEQGELWCLANKNCTTQGLCCDILNFGSSQTMDSLSGLYDDILNGVVVEPIAASGERFLTRWCALHQIPFKYASVKCSILRSNGTLLEIP